MTTLDSLSLPSSLSSSSKKEIATVITKLNDHDSITLETYKKFLSLSSQSNEEIKKRFPLHVSCTSRYTTEVDLNKDKVYNSSLKNVFLFYARLQQTGVGTFDEQAVMNETISNMELIAFCRDFRLIPKLLSVKDVNFVWQGMEAEWYIINKSETFNSLGYNEFLDCLVRLAIFSYSKPGLQRLILNINGFKPTPEEKVEYFAKYLHLDDQYWVKNQIETIGKETQRNLYSRSGGTNDAIKRYLRDDILANQMDRVLGQKSHQETSTLLENESALPNFDLSIHEDEKPKREATSKGSQLLPRAIFQVLYPNDVLEEESVMSMNNSLKQVLLRRGSVFMNSMNTLNSIRATNDGGKIGHHGHANVKVGHNTGQAQLNENPMQSPTYSPEKPQRGYKEKGIMKINPAILVDERLRDYDSSLVQVFARYGYFKPSAITSDVVNSEGPFLDMGYLPVGTDCVARFQLTNTSSYDLKIDVMAKGFEFKNTRVTTLPGMLVSGLCRAVSVSFTVEPGPNRDQLAVVEVICANITKGIIKKITCPVYYRIRQQVPSQQAAITTIRNLPTLINKYCNVKPNLTLNNITPKEYWQKPSFIDLPSPRTYAESQQLKTLKGVGVLRIGDLNNQSNGNKPKTNMRPSTAPIKRREDRIVTTKEDNNEDKKATRDRIRPNTASAIRKY